MSIIEQVIEVRAWKEYRALTGSSHYRLCKE